MYPIRVDVQHGRCGLGLGPANDTHAISITGLRLFHKERDATPVVERDSRVKHDCSLLSIARWPKIDVCDPSANQESFRAFCCSDFHNGFFFARRGPRRSENVCRKLTQRRTGSVGDLFGGSSGRLDVVTRPLRQRRILGMSLEFVPRWPLA